MEKRQITVLPGSPLAKAVERSFQDKTPFWYEGGKYRITNAKLQGGTRLLLTLEDWNNG